MLAGTKTAHARLVGVTAQSESGANKTQAGLDGSIVHLGEVKHEAKLALINLYKTLEQFAGSGKTPKVALRQRMEVSKQAQLLE